MFLKKRFNELTCIRLCFTAAPFLTVLMQKPQLLLLDESTSALDRQTEQSVLSNIAASCPSLTILHVTHRMDSIIHADEIWLMDGGRFLAKGTHEELMSSSRRYREFYFAQSGNS